MKQNMQQRKLELIEKFIAITDSKALTELETIVLKHTDWWDELSDPAKASIKRGENDLKNGRIKPHKEVMKKYKKWTVKK